MYYSPVVFCDIGGEFLLFLTGNHRKLYLFKEEKRKEKDLKHCFSQ